MGIVASVSADPPYHPNEQKRLVGDPGWRRYDRREDGAPGFVVSRDPTSGDETRLTWDTRLCGGTHFCGVRGFVGDIAREIEENCDEMEA